MQARDTTATGAGTEGAGAKGEAPPASSTRPCRQLTKSEIAHAAAKLSAAEERREADSEWWRERSEPHPLTAHPSGMSLLMPRRAVNAAIAAAHNYDIEATEYCRRAILLRLAADGMNLRDFGEAA